MENTSQNRGQRVFKGVVLSEDRSEKFIQIKENEEYLNSDYVYVIDNQFF